MSTDPVNHHHERERLEIKSMQKQTNKKPERERNLRVLAARALVSELICDVVTVTARHHGQLRMQHCGFAGVQLPEGAVPVSHAIDEPGCSVAQLVDEGVPETICHGTEAGGDSIRQKSSFIRTQSEMINSLPLFITGVTF